MPKRFPVRAMLFACLLAGCAGPSHRPLTNAGDWTSDEIAAVAASSPRPSLPVRPPGTPVAMASNKPVLTRAPPQITGTWIDLRRWCTANNLGAPELVSLLPLPAYRIKTPDGFLLLQANSRTAFCNGLELRLGFPLQ